MNDKKKIIQTLQQENNFLVVSHLNPDGDAIGSSVALGFILKKLNKNFSLYNASGLPEKFSWLKLPKKFCNTLPPQKPKWIIILDCGDKNRMGDEILPWLETCKTINMDHHLHNPLFGSLNLVNENASCVGEIIADLCVDLNIEITGALAEAIYLAIISDTGYFTYSNTTSYAHFITSRMIEQGLNVGKINSILSQTWSLNKIKLMSLVLETTELFQSGEIAVIQITQSMFKKTNTGPEDCEGFINYIRNIKKVKVAVSLREEKDNTIKFSLRSYDKVNVQQIASNLGGGGHKNAAGGILKCSLNEAKKIIINEIRKVL
ncbi:DHH family phosphoesterase [Desulfonauticus submarinus]